jgi:hypothetical protein
MIIGKMAQPEAQDVFYVFVPGADHKPDHCFPNFGSHEAENVQHLRRTVQVRVLDVIDGFKVLAVTTFSAWSARIVLSLSGINIKRKGSFIFPRMRPC